MGGYLITGAINKPIILYFVQKSPPLEAKPLYAITKIPLTLCDLKDNPHITSARHLSHS